MKKHVRNYLASRNLTGYEPRMCEWCGRAAAEARELDVHHIRRRGIGGNKNPDHPHNLIALCRDKCHKDADHNKISEQDLLERAAAIIEECK